MDNLNVDRPIFIVGAPRSGTTLLQYMLRSHPRISLPTGESHFMIPLYRNANSFGDLKEIEGVRRVLRKMYQLNHSFLEEELHGMRFDVGALAIELHSQSCNTIPKIIAGLLGKNARGEGKLRWGDKTPYYVLHLPIILEMFPNAQIIHIIRDGRDCAFSMFGRKYDFNVYNVYFAAKYWQKFVEAGQAAGQNIGEDAYQEIRYEHLLMDQIETLKKICAFISEEYTDSLIHFKKPAQAMKTPLLQKPVQKNNAGKWKRLMTSRQIRVFESAAGDTLVRNGYPLQTKSKPLPPAFEIAYRLHNKVISLGRNYVRRYRSK